MFVLTFGLGRSMSVPVVDNASEWDIEATKIVTQYQHKTTVFIQDVVFSMIFHSNTEFNNLVLTREKKEQIFNQHLNYVTI